MENPIIIGDVHDDEENEPQNENNTRIIVSDSYGGPRTKKQEQEMKDLGRSVYGTKESDKRRGEIEDRLEEIEKDHQQWRDKGEKEALEEELAKLEKREPLQETEVVTDSEATQQETASYEPEAVAPEVTEETYRRRGSGRAHLEKEELANPFGDGEKTENEVESDATNNTEVPGESQESVENQQETETRFERALNRISREDPEAAERIRRTVGLESHPEELAGEEFQEITLRQFEQRRSVRERVGSWVKERVKGAVTFGWWETHQAEKFRTGTREVADDIEVQARLIRQEEGVLSQDVAFEEAERMRNLFEQAGVECPNASEYEIISNIVTQEKIGVNMQIEDRLVSDALSRLEERLRDNSRVQEYISYSGEQVITQERLRQVEDRIRNAIRTLRRGQSNEDIFNYRRSIREALDREWYKRYVATGVEMTLGAVALKWVVPHMFTGSTEITKGATEAVKGLKDTIWDDTRDFLTNNGITNPTNKQILEASKMVAQDSGVSVGQWGIHGSIIDTKMPAGYLLKFGRVAANISKIASL
jgi:hypothetical protein